MGGAVAAVGLGSLGSVGIANAATKTNTNPQQSLIEKLATTFKLNKDDVKKVFDEEHASRQAEHTADMKTKLDAAVKAGTINQDQEDKIIAKAAELQKTRQADMDAFKDKTPAERKAAMEAKRAEIDKWISDNGIPTEFARFVMGDGPGSHRGHRGTEGKGGGMGHGGMMHDDNDSDSEAPSAN